MEQSVPDATGCSAGIAEAVHFTRIRSFHAGSEEASARSTCSGLYEQKVSSLLSRSVHIGSFLI